MIGPPRRSLKSEGVYFWKRPTAGPQSDSQGGEIDIAALLKFSTKVHHPKKQKGFPLACFNLM